MNDDTYASPCEAKAANDSRLLRPKSVCGTREIVTTECRRPDDVDACKREMNFVKPSMTSINQSMTRSNQSPEII